MASPSGEKTLRAPDGELRWAWRDVTLNMAVPLIAGAIAYVGDPIVSRNTLGSMLAVVGILTGLLFQLVISVLSTLQREAEREREPRSIELAEKYVRLLVELDANITYAVLIGCITAAGLAVALLFGTAEWTQVGITLLAAILAHFLQVLLMVLKRYRALGVEAGKEARRTLRVARRKAS
jgi:hypothetical protein